MSEMTSQIINLTIVYSNVYSGADQINDQSSASPLWWEFTGGRMPKQNGPVTRKNVSIWLCHHVKSDVYAGVIMVITLLNVVLNLYVQSYLVMISWLMHVYHIFAWVSSFGSVLFTANLLAMEYRLICKWIKLKSDEGWHQLNRCIGGMRRRHWKLSQDVG